MKTITVRTPVDTPHGMVNVDVQVREGTSDLAICHQILCAHAYDLRRLRRHAEINTLYEAALNVGRKPLIIDLGANIGVAALYFAAMWPSCHVLAVEPAADNFQLLLENTEAVENITAWNAAVAGSAGRARIADPHAEKWAYQTSATSDKSADSVPAITVGNILQEFPLHEAYTPFFIKIDIEGAEADVFSMDTKWIENFPLLIIELHDWMLCGQANSASFLRAIAPLGRDFLHIGESVFSIANPLPAIER